MVIAASLTQSGMAVSDQHEPQQHEPRCVVRRNTLFHAFLSRLIATTPPPTLASLTHPPGAFGRGHNRECGERDERRLW